MSLQIERQVEIPLISSEREAMKWLDQALQKAAEVEKVNDAVISVQIVDDDMIQQLNQQYRQIHQPTDVLSFPQFEADEEKISLPGQPLPLGDIVISLPRAKQQATEFGHPLERELGFLAVHGFLHLLGYDHQSPEEEKVMFMKQEEILKQIGLQR